MPTVRSLVFPWQHLNPNPSPHSVGSWPRLGARAPAPSPPRPMGSPACLPFYLLYKMGLGGIQLVATWPGVDAQIATRGLFFLNFSPSVSMNVGFGGRAVVPDDAIVSSGDGRSVGEFSPLWLCAHHAPSSVAHGTKLRHVPVPEESHGGSKS